MGLVRPCGCGPGESYLRRVCVICRFLYSLVTGLGFRGDGRSGGVGEVLVEDPGTAVEIGPGGVGRR